MSVELRVQELLERYPTCRQSYNTVVMGYWVKMDRFGEGMSDFRKVTPVETILREARTLFSRRPDLSPEAYHADHATSQDLFTMLHESFPGTVTA